jgi:uncharacterized RDD family membrane protein YckC
MAYGPPTTLDPTNVMGRRIAAWFIDIVIPSIVAIAVGYIVFIGAATKISGVSTDYCTFQPRPTNSACLQLGSDAYIGTDDDVRAAFTVGGLIYLVGALNLFVVQGLTGATVGKHMVGLRVVKADGSVAGFGSNALRTLLLIVDQFFCALVGLITALATHPHRRVGDMAAGTFVVAKQSAGTPIATQMGVAPYPQSWTPPSQTTWGQPAAGGAQPWGAPPPGWGAPPSTGPPPAATPPAWGTPAASPPVVSTPPSEVTSEPTAEDAPGWGAPTSAAQPAPAPASEPAPQAAAPQATAPGANREPQWDAQRNAWVYWEAETSRWLQFDPGSGQWGPLR